MAQVMPTPPLLQEEELSTLDLLMLPSFTDVSPRFTSPRWASPRCVPMSPKVRPLAISTDAALSSLGDLSFYDPTSARYGFALQSPTVGAAPYANTSVTASASASASVSASATASMSTSVPPIGITTETTNVTATTENAQSAASEMPANQAVSHVNTHQGNNVQQKSTSHAPHKQASPQTQSAATEGATKVIDKLEERRRKNRESSSRCYYNRKKVIEGLERTLTEEKRKAIQLYARELELRHENARLKRDLVIRNIRIPASMLTTTRAEPFFPPPVAHR